MKKLLFLIASFLMISTIAFSQKEIKLTIEVSSDSVLLGNYLEVKFTIENAEVKNFEAPSFDGFNIISGPNQSSSMMINNGEVTQSVSYSYYLEPNDVGSYYIQPAFVDTGGQILESMPIEVNVMDNPDGIIQNSQQKKINDFFSREDFFGGNDFFSDFFNRDRNPLFQEIEPIQPKKKEKSKKKKRKIYKL